MSIIEELRQHINEIDSMENAAFDLWTWLPVRVYADRAYGDYASEFRGSAEVVMLQALRVISTVLYVPDAEDIRKYKLSGRIPEAWDALN